MKVPVKKKMKTNERITDYLDSLCPGNSAVTEEIRKCALEHNMPIIRRESEPVLRTLLAMKRPDKILEVGTNVGYSSLVMSECCDANITTLEIGEADYLMAVENIKKAGRDNQIECIHIDATEYLKNCDESFDFIFMDAAKGQYISWLPDIERIITPGGVLVSDNVLLDGDTIESRFAIDRRMRTEHGRMREYLYELTHSDKWQSTVINLADGMAVCVRL